MFYTLIIENDQERLIKRDNNYTIVEGINRIKIHSDGFIERNKAIFDVNKSIVVSLAIETSEPYKKRNKIKELCEELFDY